MINLTALKQSKLLGLLLVIIILIFSSMIVKDISAIFGNSKDDKVEQGAKNKALLEQALEVNKQLTKEIAKLKESKVINETITKETVADIKASKEDVESVLNERNKELEELKRASRAPVKRSMLPPGMEIKDVVKASDTDIIKVTTTVDLPTKVTPTVWEEQEEADKILATKVAMINLKAIYKSYDLVMEDI